MQVWLLLLLAPVVLPAIGVVVTVTVPLLIGTMLFISPILLFLGTAVYFTSGMRSQVKARTSSVDPSFSRIIRSFQQIFSLRALRSGSIWARKFLRLSILKESKELVHENWPIPELAGEVPEQKGFKIETITFPGSSGKGNDGEEEEEVPFVFFHGGALSLCDSADLLMCQRLLPLISHFCGGAKVKMYSVLYTLEDEKDEGTWTTVQRQIAEAYDMIAKAVKKERPEAEIVAIMGDSAGGHLSLCLGLQLIHRDSPHIPGLALISPWLNCFSGERYPDILSRERFKDDFLHNRFLQSSIVNYWAGANHLDEASFELRTQSELSLPAHVVNPWLSDKAMIQKLPSILCLAGSDEVLYDEISEFWDTNVDPLPALKTPGGAKQKQSKVKFVDSDESAGEVQTQQKGLTVDVAKSSQVKEKTRANNATGLRELHITEGEVHAFALFWRHPLRRVLGPLGLNALFELFYPPAKIEPVTPSFTPSTPGGTVTSTPATPSDAGYTSSTWREVATPRPLQQDNSPVSPITGLLPSISESTIDSHTADAAIERLARYVATEYAALRIS